MQIVACGVLAVASGLVLVGSTATPSPARLKSDIGRSVSVVVKELGLEGAGQGWVDEPPGVLRGRCYTLPDKTTVTLYIARQDPMYRKFSDRREWNLEAFRRAKVGGIQYQSAQASLDIGDDIPFQFRRHQ
jgi:hypothetical protein